MRALFQNALNDSVITATGSSINYPIESIIHRFMKKRWQSSAQSSVISIVFNSVKTINCIFYAYHTFDTFSFQLFNSAGSVIYSGSDSNIMEYGCIYFSSVTGVKRMDITVHSSVVLRAGLIWSGEYYQMPNFISGYEKKYIDASSVDYSDDFQSSQLYTAPARVYGFILPETNDVVKDRIMAEYFAKGIGNPFFIDPTESNRLKLKPDYVVFSKPPDSSKNGRMFNISCEFKESR